MSFSKTKIAIFLLIMASLPAAANDRSYSVYSENLENALFAYGLCTASLIKDGHYPASAGMESGNYSSSDYKPPAIGKSIFQLWARCSNEVKSLSDACIAGGESSAMCSKKIADITNQQLINLNR